MNKHIEINLKNYITSNMPEYAVLLSGKWGSGKTFFIDDFIKRNKSDDIHFIKISLFGLKDISAISHKIIFKLLSIKEKSFWGDVAIVGVKVLDSFGKKLNLSIQDVPIEQIINKLNGEFIFIFDDLERTDIKSSELLGYINHFVEQADFKIIIVANENEITKDDKYREFKEKVIGKTYEVQQNFDTIFQKFLDLTMHSKEILSHNAQNIKEVYTKSTYNNLRYIRQAVIDFDYFYNLLNDKYKSHPEFINKFIYVFFSLSIEIRKGILLEAEFTTPNYISWDNLSGKKEEKDKTEYERILKKYILTAYGSLLLPTTIWVDILFKNLLIKEDINKEISNTAYFYNETYESWSNLYRYQSLEDEEYKDSLQDVMKKFNNNEYLEHEKLLTVIALLLYLSKINLCSIPRDKILEQAKKNIISNCQSELWKSKAYTYKNINDGYRYNGTIYSYYDNKTNDFKYIRDFLKEESLKSFNIGLTAKAESLLLDFRTDNIESIEHKLYEEFRSINIFSYIDKHSFQKAILKISHNNLATLTTILDDRYGIWNLTSNYPILLKETILWEYINSNILVNIDKNINPLKYYLMEEFKRLHLNIIINNIIEATKKLDEDNKVEITTA